MSVQTEGERESIDLPNHGDLAFAALMDALAPESAEEGAGAGEVPGGDSAAPGGQPQSGGAPAPGGGGNAVEAGGQPAQPAAGSTQAGGPGDAKAGQPAQGVPPGSGAPAAGGAEQPAAPSQGADLPADWTASADELTPKFGELSTKLEENITKAFQQQAYDQAKSDYENYFLALDKHPRLLVGTEVPAIGKEGMEVLRTSEDAKEWQEAVRGLLVQEIRENAQVKFDEARDFMETIHASIDLFKNNKDLIPGTKTFDRELADTFAKMVTPYEVRVDGKLQGYSIPVQPIIDSLRQQIVTRRQTAPNPPPAAPAPPASRQRQAEPPQAGIQSKAASTTEKEDFSTLFGTIGLPNLQI